MQGFTSNFGNTDDDAFHIIRNPSCNTQKLKESFPKYFKYFESIALFLRNFNFGRDQGRRKSNLQVNSNLYSRNIFDAFSWGVPPRHILAVLLLSLGSKLRLVEAKFDDHLSLRFKSGKRIEETR